MSLVRYSGAQRSAMVEEYESGAKVPDICRRHGVSERTLYRWLRSSGAAGQRTAGQPAGQLTVQGVPATQPG